MRKSEGASICPGGELDGSGEEEGSEFDSRRTVDPTTRGMKRRRCGGKEVCFEYADLVYGRSDLGAEGLLMIRAELKKDAKDGAAFEVGGIRRDRRVAVLILPSMLISLLLGRLC